MRHADTCGWVGLEDEEDGRKIMIRARAQVPQGIATDDYPLLVNLYWRVAAPSQSGMPSAEELEKMLTMDELLNQMDGPEIGFMMFSVTGNMRKEWIWYVRSDAEFVRDLNQCLAGHEPFPIEIETAPARGWANYDEIVSPFRTDG
jgi:Family of unknown function (DUF695)